MFLNWILGSLAGLSCALTLWQWLAARRFPLHQRAANKTFSPAVTLLKPLKGRDAETEECLRSWFAQEYPPTCTETVAQISKSAVSPISKSAAGETIEGIGLEQRPAGLETRATTHPTPVQILFGVASAEDPVCELVEKLIRENPQTDAQLVICGESLGPNAKVSKLTQLERHAKNEILIISDADVRVPKDFLANVVQPFNPERGCVEDQPQHVKHSESLENSKSLRLVEDDTAALRHFSNTLFETSQTNETENVESRLQTGAPVGLVNCFYRLANPSTLAMHWEAIAINADFWSQVLQSQTLKPLDFALGAVMATRRDVLKQIGGFESLVGFLADDYQLGNKIARAGKQIVLSPVVVECWESPMNWKRVWSHQLRWARTIRVCQPAPFFFSILSNATLWPLLFTAALFAEHHRIWFVPISFFLPVRIQAALKMQEWLTRDSKHYAWFWLVPIKDLLAAAIWFCAFIGNKIEWRGEKFRVLRGGKLQKLG